MSSPLQAISRPIKTEVEVAAKTTETIRQSGILGIGRILGSKEGSAILSAVAGAAIAAATSSSPAGLFAAATCFLLSENFRLSIKNSIAFKAADVAIADRIKNKLTVQAVPKLQEEIKHLEHEKNQLAARNEQLFESNKTLVNRLINKSLGQLESTDQPGASFAAKCDESKNESDDNSNAASSESSAYPSLLDHEIAPDFLPLH